uniref:DNA cytosine methyltransferase n=1 Tax=Calothrix sp. PCC 6303 TaxID=1170562 RepID=UPI0002F69A03
MDTVSPTSNNFSLFPDNCLLIPLLNHTSSSSNRPVAIDLFAGAGGFSLGMEQAGFDILVAVEYDPIHASTHAFNFPLTETLCSDIADVTGKMILQAADKSWRKYHQHDSKACQKWNKKIDLVFGGPPCQGFSLMGKRDLEDIRNNLIFHFCRLVLELRPKYFVMENVPGITTGKYKKTLLQLENAFENAGYNVRQTVLNAADFSVPQKRQRLFLVGSSNPQGFDIPFPIKASPLQTTVRDAISDLPDIDTIPQLINSDEVLLTESQLQIINQKTTPYIQFLRCNFPLPNLTTFQYPRYWNPQILTSSMQTQHEESSKTRFLETPQGELDPISRLRRLKLDGFSHTLRAGTDKQRGRHTSPRPIHPTFPRVITVREAARLHSFPDWFRFHQTKWHGFRQVGNAVPPLLARTIGERIITALNIQPSHPQTILDLGDTQLLRFVPTTAQKYWDNRK